MNDGGTAFPSHEHFIANGGATGDRKVITGQPHGGMSLRDYFAAAAIAHMQVGGHDDEALTAIAPFVARASYVIADAMLIERSKGVAHGA